jgi:hypothetical protein
MVDLEGSCIGKAANSGTLSVIEIRLSPTAPQEVIQQILALVVDPSTKTSAAVRVEAKGTITVTGEVHPRYGQVQLVPFDAKAKLIFAGSMALLLWLSTVSYNVTGTADNILKFLEDYRNYLETKKDGSVVPIDQAKETIKNAERSKPTPKNEHHEKSGSPSVITSKGD